MQKIIIQLQFLNHNTQILRPLTQGRESIFKIWTFVAYQGQNFLIYIIAVYMY